MTSSIPQHQQAAVAVHAQTVGPEGGERREYLGAVATKPSVSIVVVFRRRLRIGGGKRKVLLNVLLPIRRVALDESGPQNEVSGRVPKFVQERRQSNAQETQILHQLLAPSMAAHAANEKRRKSGPPVSTRA